MLINRLLSGLFSAMKYRSRYQIITKILQVVNRGATKTQIMFGAYLSSRQTKEYTGFLAERDLIRVEPATKRYALTDKGLRMLQACEEIDRLVGEEGEQPVPSKVTLAAVHTEAMT